MCELTKEQFNANEQFFARCVFPLVLGEFDSVHIRGSGSFFMHNDEFYLITAAHVVSDIDAMSLGVPVSPLKDVSIRKIGDCTVLHPLETDVDVAVVRLDDKDFISTVVKNWIVLTEENVLDSSQEVEDYAIAGYPIEDIKIENGNIVPDRLFQLYTGEYIGEVDGKVEKHDLILRYAEKASDINGHCIVQPRMEGASGAPVWAIVSTDTKIWAPEKILGLVGIQSAFKPKSYVRTMRWMVVEEIFDKLRASKASS